MRKIKRRYKLLIIIIFSGLLVIISYKFFNKKNSYLVSIGDYLSMGKILDKEFKNYDDYILDSSFNLKLFSKNNSYYTSEKLLYDLHNNESKVDYFIKNANFVLINIGNYELNNYKELNNEIITDYLNNIYSVITHVKKINKKCNIVIFNIYDKDKKFSYVNNKLKKYSELFEAKYIDLNSFSEEEYYYLNNKFYLNSKSSYKISKMILKND